MKAGKKLSILLSTLLTLNLLQIGSLKVKAEETANPITLKSVSVNSKLALQDSEAVISVEASSSAGELENEASALLVQQNGNTQTEKEVTLTLEEGKYEAKLPISGANDYGQYQISFLIIGDKASNTQIFYNSKVHGNFGVDLSAANFTAALDDTKPELSKITLDKNMIYPGGQLTVTLDASDDLAGLAEEANLVYVTKTLQGDVEKELTLNLQNGKYQGTLKVNDEAEVGNWRISFITLADKAGNVNIIYNTNVHQNVPGTDLSSGNFTVKLDTEGPQFTGIILDKNIAKLNDKIGIAVAATDVSGLNEEANLVYTIKSGDSVLEKEVTLNIVDGLYKGELVVDESFVSGTWELSYVILQDSRNNVTPVYNSRVHGIGQNLSSANFVVDFVSPNKPTISLSTETPTNKDVEVTITAPEANAKLEYKLEGNGNWIEYKGSFLVSENTSVHARAIDAAGNVSEDAVKHVTNIDKKAPVITVSGAENNGLYNKDVNLNVTVDEKETTVTKSLTLNGKEIEIGKLDKEGTYVLKVTAVDKALNTSSIQYTFAIDKTAPVITIEGIEADKTYTNVSVTPVIKTEEGATLTLTLDGKAYDGKTAISSTGNHKIIATAVDKAGNKTVEQIKFTIEAVVSEDTTLIDTINDLVINTDSEDEVIIDITNKPVVTSDVLKLLKGVDKQITLVVKSQGIELKWTFNGKDIKAVDVDLDLTLNAVSPNKDIISKIDVNAQVLSFKHHGELPAPMIVTVPIDTTKLDVTKPIYLYYYNETTKKVELIPGELKPYKIGDKYYVDITLTHFSDYFLSSMDNTSVSNKVDKLVKTGSPVDMNALVALGIALIAIGGYVLVFRRRRTE